MTTHKTTLNSAEFTIGDSIETADGRLIKVNSFCVTDAPLKGQPLVSLEGLKCPDKFRTRDGQVFTVTTVLESERTLHATSDGCRLGRIFRFDGMSALDCYTLGAVEILKSEKPRVSLDGARKGDRFLTREGRTYTYTGGKTFSGQLKTVDSAGVSGLNFRRDGYCPGVHCADVVEVIKPTLLEQIQAEMKGLDTENVEEIVINSNDWREITRDDGALDSSGYLCVEGVRVFHTPETTAGGYSVRFRLR